MDVAAALANNMSNSQAWRTGAAMYDFMMDPDQWIDGQLKTDAAGETAVQTDAGNPQQLIREALEHDRLVLFGQRIMPLYNDFAERRRVEILLRLITRDNTLIPPNVFIPEAEHCGLIRILDRHLMEKAFSTMAHQLPQAGLPLDAININLSAVTISEPDFIDYTIQALAHYRLPASCVCFEITETAEITDFDVARDFVCHVQSMGARIALDDFGIGYTSFENFRHLPVNYLKIPGYFVRDLAFNYVDQALVESICSMAKRLGIETVAEGVEDQETLQFLRSVGCDHAQGFLLHRPEPWPILHRLSRSEVFKFPGQYRTH